MPKTKKEQQDDIASAPPLDIGLPKSMKAFDIVPQNKTMPSQSSKPVIVSTRKIVKDPMVNATDAAVDEKKPEKKATTKIVIQPLHDDVSADEDTPSAEDAAPALAEPEAEAATTIEAIEPEANEVPEFTLSEQPQPEQKTEDTEPSPEAEATASEPEEKVEAPAEKNNDNSEQSPADNAPSAEVDEITKKANETKLASKELEEAEKRQKEMEALIESKQYFVPINAVKKRKSKRLVWTLLFLIILALAAIAALDAGLTDIIPAPTNFIN